jgi:exosome complex RNA-binding protein Rrp42 (RNase PH superfamily)
MARSRGMIYVTAIHLVGGDKHEHIASVQWQNPVDGKAGESTRETMVDWINDGGDARVKNGGTEVRVGVIRDATRPYIRTHADGQWTNNLLALRRY